MSDFEIMIGIGILLHIFMLTGIAAELRVLRNVIKNNCGENNE